MYLTKCDCFDARLALVRSISDLNCLSPQHFFFFILVIVGHWQRCCQLSDMSIKNLKGAVKYMEEMKGVPEIDPQKKRTLVEKTS